MEDINIERAEKWKKPVAKYYGVYYGLRAERNVRSSYKELLEVLNIAASVKAQSEWQIRARNSVREPILDKCAAIADEWKKGSDGTFEEDSTTLSDYHEVVRLYYAYPVIP